MAVLLLLAANSTNWHELDSAQLVRELKGADGNPATDPDPAWTSFIATPPFPDYVSGHSTFSGAAASVLAHFYGTDDIAFAAGSDFLVCNAALPVFPLRRRKRL